MQPTTSQVEKRMYAHQGEAQQQREHRAAGRRQPRPVLCRHRLLRRVRAQLPRAVQRHQSDLGMNEGMKDNHIE